MNQDTIITAFTDAINNNQEDYVNSLLNEHIEVIRPIIALSYNNNALDWANAPSHPICIAIDKGYFSLLKMLLNFIQQDNLEQCKIKYSLVNFQLKNKKYFFSVNEIGSLQLIFDTTYPKNVVLNVQQEQIFDCMFELMADLAPNINTVHRVFSKISNEQSLGLIAHFLPKLLKEIQDAELDYSDLRGEVLLDIVNMTPNNKIYFNRSLSTLMQSVYLAMRYEHFDVIKTIVDNTDIVYWPTLPDTNILSTQKMHQLVDKKQLYTQLNQEINSNKNNTVKNKI